MPDEKPKPTLKLEMVKELLGQLVDKGFLSDEQQKRVLDLRKDPKYEGKFVGQIAVSEGMVTDAQINVALLAQVVAKGNAVEDDLHTIATGGAQKHAKFLEANWGNKGVNKATDKPSVTVAATSAIANTAQNIVMWVNDHHPGLAGEKEVADGVKAAARLTRFIAGASDERLTEKEAGELRKQAMAALRRVTGKDELLDKSFNPKEKPADVTMEEYKSQHTVPPEDYIREREIEINRGIAERLRSQQQSQNMPMEPLQQQPLLALGRQPDTIRRG